MEELPDIDGLARQARARGATFLSVALDDPKRAAHVLDVLRRRAPNLTRFLVKVEDPDSSRRCSRANGTAPSRRCSSTTAPVTCGPASSASSRTPTSVVCWLTFRAPQPRKNRRPNKDIHKNGHPGSSTGRVRERTKADKRWSHDATLRGQPAARNISSPSAAVFVGCLLVSRVAPAATSVEKLQEFSLDQVQVTDAYYQNLFSKDLTYLITTLNYDRLLAPFKAVGQGKDPTTASGLNLYGGWEAASSLIKGHSLGHHMSALAHGYQQALGSDATMASQIKTKIDYIVTQLQSCAGVERVPVRHDDEPVRRRRGQGDRQPVGPLVHDAQDRRRPGRHLQVRGQRDGAVGGQQAGRLDLRARFGLGFGDALAGAGRRVRRHERLPL